MAVTVCARESDRFGDVANAHGALEKAMCSCLFVSGRRKFGAL